MSAAVSQDAGPTTVRVIRARRLYEQIAEEIIRLMNEGGMEPGDRLPSEFELAGQLGVSRPSVREAMIALETAMLIEVKTGDGTYIRQCPDASFRMPWSRADDPGPGPREQYEAQEILECEAVALAAAVITAEEINRLEDIVDRMARRIDRGENPVEEQMAFHIELAQASGNGVIVGYVRELWAMRQKPMWDVMRGHAAIPESLLMALESRRQLIICLRNRDARGARTTLRKHFRRMRNVYFAEQEDAAANQMES